MFPPEAAYIVVGLLLFGIASAVYNKGRDERNDLYDKLVEALGPSNVRRYNGCGSWQIAVRRKGGRVRLAWPHEHYRQGYNGDVDSQDLTWKHETKTYSFAEFVAMVKEELELKRD